MDLATLNAEQLREFYQAQTALLRGVEPDEVTVPDKSDGFFQRRIEAQFQTLHNNQSLAARETDIGEDRDTPLSKFQSKASTAISNAAGLSAADIMFLQITAAQYNFPIELDATLSEAETGYISQILDGQNTGLSIAAIRSNGQGIKDEFARTAADKLRLEELAKAEALAAEEKFLSVEAGAAALGYDTFNGEFTLGENRFPSHFPGQGHPLDQMLADNQYILTREFGVGLPELRNSMFVNAEGGNYTLTENATKVVSYLVENADLTEVLSEKLASGDPEQIKFAQHILGVDGTGELNSATAKSLVSYTEEERGLGSIYETSRELANGTVLTSINTSALTRSIANGTIPTDEAALAGLPEIVREDLEGLPPTEFAETLALHLSDKANFDSFDSHLKGLDRSGFSADLQAKIPELEQAEEAARLAAATTVETAAPEIVAAVAPDVVEAGVARNPLGVEQGSALAKDATDFTVRGTATYSTAELGYDPLATALITAADDQGNISLKDAVRIAHYGGTDEANWTTFGMGTSAISSLTSIAERLPRRDDSVRETYNVNDPEQLSELLGATTVVARWRAYQPEWAENGNNAMAAFKTGLPDVPESKEWTGAADAVARRLTGTVAPEVEKDVEEVDKPQLETGADLISSLSTPFRTAGSVVAENNDPQGGAYVVADRIAASPIKLG